MTSECEQAVPIIRSNPSLVLAKNTAFYFKYINAHAKIGRTFVLALS